MQQQQPVWISVYRVVFALATLVAMAYQYIDRVDLPDFRTANFFSFFTIQSNIFAAGVLLYGAFRVQRGSRTPTFDLVRGAAVLYMSITGVVYGLLLSGYQEELQTAIPWVDTVVHRLIPLVMVVDWLIDGPSTRIELRRALVWLAYPMLYLVYSLIRGPIVDWYPYPFLDPDEAGGYLGVFVYSVAIAAGTLLFIWLLVMYGQRVQLGGRAVDAEPRLGGSVM
jgi:hypothetical protein